MHYGNLSQEFTIPGTLWHVASSCWCLSSSLCSMKEKPYINTVTQPWTIFSQFMKYEIFWELVEGHERTHSSRAYFNTLWSHALDLWESKYRAFLHFGMITTKIQWPTVLWANMISFFLAIAKPLSHNPPHKIYLDSWCSKTSSVDQGSPRAQTLPFFPWSWT